MYKVLYVGENEVFVNKLRDVLRSEPVNVYSAANTAEASGDQPADGAKHQTRKAKIGPATCFAR